MTQRLHPQILSLYVQAKKQLLKTSNTEDFQLFKMQKEVAHWKANHQNLVMRNALLEQRPDLPIDRIPAYKELIRLQNQNAKLAAALQVVVTTCLGQNTDASQKLLDIAYTELAPETLTTSVRIASNDDGSLMYSFPDM